MYPSIGELLVELAAAAARASYEEEKALRLFIEENIHLARDWCIEKEFNERLVPVDLRNCSTDELIYELESRDEDAAALGAQRSVIHQIYQLLSNGRKSEADEKVRKLVMDLTGRILP